LFYLPLVDVHEVRQLASAEACCQEYEVSGYTILNLGRDAAEEVMNQYKNTLDKINGARDKTDFNINRIKTLMTKAESDT
jgi:uncharacterized protein YpuA (DUF1002 family)